MSVTNYTNARKNLKVLIEQVNANSDPVIITTKDNNNAVLISEAEYNKFVETIYLLQNPANAKHLARSMEQLEQCYLQIGGMMILFLSIIIMIASITILVLNVFIEIEDKRKLKLINLIFGGILVLFAIFNLIQVIQIIILAVSISPSIYLGEI